MRRRLEPLVLLFLCAAAALLLPSHQSAQTGDASPSAPPAYVPLSIAGVRPGMTRARAEQFLGQGRTLEVRGGVETTAYGSYSDPDSPGLQERWVTVTWREDGTAGRIRGSHLHDIGGRELLGRGWAQEEAARRLGAPDVVSGKYHRDTDGRSSWNQYWNERGLTVTVSEGQLAHFSLEP